MSTLKTNNIQHVDRSDPSIIISTDGGVSIAGTLTYEDVTNVDSVGIITARSNILVGSGVTLSPDGNIFATGVITATSYNGDGSNLTGIDLSAVTGATGDFSIADKIVHTGDTDTTIRFPSADVFTAETGGSERLRCDSDGVKVQNGRFYSAGTFGYIESSSTSIATLTLKKTASGADSIDYLQLRDNSNDIKFTISGDGTVKILDSITHEGDTDTKIRFPASNTITAETGGSERLRIDSSGRVIITNDSVTNPTGTNTQYAPLVVRGNTSATSARAAFITFARSEASANIAADEGIGEIYFGDQQAGEYAAIRCHADAAAAVGDYPGRLTFHTTADGGTTMYERLRIDRNGKIGVGGAPSAWQAGTISNVIQLGTACIFNYNNDYFHVGQNFYYDGSNYKYVANDFATRLLQDNGKFTFYQAASGSADANITWTEALHIASDGNVHINTTDNGTANSKVNIEDSSSVGVNVLKLINKPSSSNGKARLELYAETSGGQGATAYIQSISGTDADGSNSANDAGLEFHTGYGGSGTDVTAVKIDNSGKTTISSHEGNNLLHLTPLAAASTSILINSWGDSGNSNNRNWAIRNRYNDHGRLEFMRGADNTGSPLTPVFVLNRDSSCAFAGSLSKASGSFKIDHPLPSKTSTHHLVHSFIEGPQADLIYRGKVDLVGGTATVNIDTVAGMSDGTFVLLNREVQCFTSNETGWTAVKGSVSGNVLTITAQDNSCTDTISWMVVGERKDPHMYDTEWTDADGKVILEPLKETEVSLGGE